MRVTTVRNRPEQVPLIGLKDSEKVQMLIFAIAEHFGQQMAEADEELIRLGDQFAAGQHVIYLTMHSEPALIRAPEKAGRR